MRDPSISVVIPVFNGERYIRQAIASVLEQTCPPAQIVVVDDGCTDSSRTIAEGFGNPVVCVAQDNRGLSAARNLGVETSSSEWIAFLDADDYWIRDKLARQIAVIRADPTVDLVYTGRTQFEVGGISEDVRAKSPEWVKRRLAFETPLTPSTVLARRSLLLQHPWPVSLRSSEDWWMFYQLSKVAKFAGIADPTAFYRLHDESLTRRDWRSVLNYAQLVAAGIQKDFSGIQRIRLKRMVDSRLFASAAIAARTHDSRESLGLITRSLIAWPLPNFRPSRYKTFLNMLIQSWKRPSTPSI